MCHIYWVYRNRSRRRASHRSRADCVTDASGLAARQQRLRSPNSQLRTPNSQLPTPNALNSIVYGRPPVLSVDLSRFTTGTRTVRDLGLARLSASSAMRTARLSQARVGDNLVKGICRQARLHLGIIRMQPAPPPASVLEIACTRSIGRWGSDVHRMAPLQFCND